MTTPGLPPSGQPPLPPSWGPPPGWGRPEADPGPIPLRPLTVGDLLGAGFGVVRRHLALLGLVAVLISALSSAVSLGILSGSGSLEVFAGGQWIDDLLSQGRMELPAGLYLATGASSLISVTGAILISGLATVCAGVDAMGRHALRGAVAGRLSGAVGVLLSSALIVGVGVSIGLSLLAVPGILLFLAWAVAAPVAAMEHAGPRAALRRSIRLTRGHRGRIFGAMLLIVVIAFAIEMLVSSVAVAAAGDLSPVAALVVSDAVTALVAALTTSWIGAVAALLYIDIRVRTENLGPVLRQFAAADRSTRAQGGNPALGQA